MAVGITSDKKLNYTAGLDITEAMKQAKILEKELAGLGVGMAPNYKAAQFAFQEATKKSREELAKLKIEEQELKNSRLKTAADIAEITKKVNENRLAQQELRNATKSAREAQKAASGSYKEASDRLNALGKEIKNTSDGFFGQSPALKAKIKEYDELNTRLKAFDATMGNHQRNVGNYPKILNNVGSELKSIALGFVSVTAVLAGAAKIINTNAEISDSLSDVQRTAGLTADEADRLAESLKKIDTRTSLKGLLEIAAIGGQVGISKDQLAGFTKAVDQLAVSLGGELQGGAEGIAKSLGVLDNVFKVTAGNGGNVEKSFNQIGSAILGLGQSGLATGDYLADFSERVGGIAKQVGLSLPTVLAYGAVLQENGVSAEVAGSSFKRLISALSTNPKGFLAVAQMADANLTLQSFTDLINNDVQGALDKFFSGLQKGGGTTTEFMDILKNLKLAQGGVSQSVAALSAGQESLNGHIQDATRDFDNATLSAEQFALKNDNLAGSIEKIGNSITNVSADPNSGLGKALKYIVDAARETIEALQDADSKLRKFLNWTPTGIIWRVLSRGKDMISNGGFAPALFGLSSDIEDIAKKAQKTQQDIADKEAAIIRGRATDIINNSKTEIDAIRKIKNEMALLAQTKKNLEFNNSIIKDLKDSSKQDFGLPKTAIDPNLELASKQFSKELKYQIGLVAELKKQYQQGFGKSFGSDSGSKSSVLPGETAAEQKKREAAAKRIADAAKRASDIAVSEQERLQAKIDELNDKGNRKSLTNDEEEVAAVKAKYDKLRAEAVKFNNDKKNIAKGLKVNTSGLDVAQTNETDAIIDKQAANALKTSISEQKALYDEYEGYKLKLGTDKAKQLADNRIDTEKTYLQYLQGLEEQLANDPKAKGGNEAKKEQQLKVLRESIATQQALVKKSNTDLLIDAYNSAKTYLQKGQEIEADYQAKRKALGVDATKEQLANLQLEKDGRIRANNESNAFAKSGYADLMERYNELTKVEVEKRLQLILAGYDAEYKAGKLTAKQLADLKGPILQQLNNLDGNNSFKAVDRLIERLKDAKKGTIEWDNSYQDLLNGVANATDDVVAIIGSVAQGLSDLGVGGEEVQKVFKNVMGVVSGFSTLAKGIATSNPVEIITGSITILTNAISLFDFKSAGIENAITRYKKRVDDLTDAFDRLQNRLSDSIGDELYANQIRQIQILTDKVGELNNAYFAEKGKKNADKDKLNDYLDQIREVELTIKEINASIAQSLIQTNFKDLSSTFADALVTSYERIGIAIKAYGDPIKEFDESFDKMVQNAIKNSLKLQILEPVVARFTEALSNYAKANNNSVIGFDFDDWQRQLRFASAQFSTALGNSGKFFVNDPITEADKFLTNLADSYLKSLESGDFAKKVADYHSKLSEATARGITSSEITAFKAQFEALLAEAKIKEDEFFKLTGQTIKIDPLTLTFSPITPADIPVIPPVELDVNAKALGDKLFDLVTKEAKDTGKSIEEILRTSILEGLRTELITDSLKPLAERIKGLYAGGKVPTKEDIAKATEEMNAFVTTAREQLGLLEKATRLTFSEVIKEEVGSAVETVNQELQSLSQSITDVFANTDGAYEAFLAKFDDMVKNKLLNGLQTNFLQTKLTGFLEQFNAIDKVDDTKKKEELAKLKAEYDRIIREGKAEYERLQDVFGVDYTSTTTRPEQGAVANSIGRAITEDTALAISGPIIGTFEGVTKIVNMFGKMYALGTENLAYQAQIEANTRRGANNTDSMQAQLDQIIANTAAGKKQSLTDNFFKI